MSVTLQEAFELMSHVSRMPERSFWKSTVSCGNVLLYYLAVTEHTSPPKKKHMCRVCPDAVEDDHDDDDDNDNDDSARSI